MSSPQTHNGVMRVLVAEDHVVLAGRIAEGLRDAGLAVDVACDGAVALTLAGLTAYDVIVRDRDLPVVHGDQVCRTLAGGSARILMLTAAAAVDDRVDGLELGADDYLGKPFAFHELVARVRALGRRAPSAPPVLRRGDPTVDRAPDRAPRGTPPLSLTRTGFGTLELRPRPRGRGLGQRRGAARARRGRPPGPVQQHRLGHGGPAAAQARRTAADRNRRGQGVPDVSIPRLTVRARLTLLYTGLFAACGAIVVA